MIYAIFWLCFVLPYYIILGMLWLLWQMLKFTALAVVIVVGGSVWLLVKIFGALRAG